MDCLLVHHVVRRRQSERVGDRLGDGKLRCSVKVEEICEEVSRLDLVREGWLRCLLIRMRIELSCSSDSLQDILDTLLKLLGDRLAALHKHLVKAILC